MKMGIHSKTTLIIGVIALPFAFSGGWVWREGVAIVQSRNVSFSYADSLGSILYFLFGFPLTGIPMRFLSPISFEDHIWVIPLLSGTVVIQWILWANLAVWTVRFIRNRRKKRKNSSQQRFPEDSLNARL